MKRPLPILLAALAIVVGAALIYFALHESGPAAAPSGPPPGPSAEMMEAMHRMHEATNKVPMTGDIDRDFVALMVPHHRSAVEMARVYLDHGKDPELRRLAENVIASQEAEIKQMRGRGGVRAGEAHPEH
jgi:uncharacterized protein (DUF305 family)